MSRPENQLPAEFVIGIEFSSIIKKKQANTLLIVE